MEHAIFTRATSCEKPGTRDATARFDGPIWLIACREEFSSSAFATVSNGNIGRTGYSCTLFRWHHWQRFFCTSTVTTNDNAANVCTHTTITCETS